MIQDEPGPHSDGRVCWHIPLRSEDGSDITGADGTLFTVLPEYVDDLEDRVYTLTVAGIWDGSLEQTYEIVLGDPPRAYELTWSLPHPPKSAVEPGESD